MTVKHDLKGEWRKTQGGRVFEVLAVDPSSGRILARASCTVPTDASTDLVLYFGRVGLDEVERSVRELCVNLADRIDQR